MKEIDATRFKLKALEIVEGTNILWWEVIRVCGRISNAPLCFYNSKENYELALGIVEGKPVWAGDRYYFNDMACIATESCKQIYWDKCTLNPPKPKMLSIELPLPVIEELTRKPPPPGSRDADWQLYAACCYAKSLNNFGYKRG